MVRKLRWVGVPISPERSMRAIAIGRYISVSYTHLRAHETDSYLFVGSVKMCIRDRHIAIGIINGQEIKMGRRADFTRTIDAGDCHRQVYICLLYTSPSPRDGLLSIRRQRQDVYKRQAYCHRNYQWSGN